jgi:hypothetical protein
LVQITARSHTERDSATRRLTCGYASQREQVVDLGGPWNASTQVTGSKMRAAANAWRGRISPFCRAATAFSINLHR